MMMQNNVARMKKKTYFCTQKLTIMRINPRYKVRDVVGEHVVIIQSPNSEDLNRIINLNETAMMLWKSLEGKDFELDDAVRLLTDTFEVDDATARKDAQNWIDTLKDNGILI